MSRDRSGIDLKAAFLNCSLKAGAEGSHTMRLLRRVAGVMEDEGVTTDIIHLRDHTIAFGMAKDLSRTETDDWPSSDSTPTAPTPTARANTCTTARSPAVL